MDSLTIYETAIEADDGTHMHLRYDQDADILDIYFAENEAATGISLTDHILLRINRTTKRAISLTLLDFAVLTARSQYGPRSFPLDGLDELPQDLRELALNLIMNAPVNQFLKLSYLQVSPTERVLFTYLEPQPIALAA